MIKLECERGRSTVGSEGGGTAGHLLMGGGVFSKKKNWRIQMVPDIHLTISFHMTIDHSDIPPPNISRKPSPMDTG